MRKETEERLEGEPPICVQRQIGFLHNVTSYIFQLLSVQRHRAVAVVQRLQVLVPRSDIHERALGDGAAHDERLVRVQPPRP